MVGTAEYHVGRNSRSHAKNMSTLQPGVHTMPDPAASDASSVLCRPCPWNSGTTLRHRSAPVSASAAIEAQADAHRLACVCGTIFGRDVVPEVRSTNATSLGLAGLCGGARPRSPARV